MGAGPATGGGARPLGIGEILDAALKLYRARAVELWKLVALIIVPVEVVDRIVFAASLPSGVYAHDGSLYAPVGTVGGAWIVVTIVLRFVAAALVIGALSRGLIDAYVGHPSGWRQSLEYAADRLAPLLWLALLTSLVVLVGFILFVIPGVYLLVALSVAVPVLMFEGIAGPAALARSRELVSGRWWPTLGALIVGVVLIIAVDLVITAVVAAIESGGHVNSVGVVIVLSGMATIVSNVLTYPLLAAITAVIYLDLRHRKEGLEPGALRRGSELDTPSAPTWPPSA
ncbi:MAG TPA: hypothetical protein VNR66_10745 [Solirubrobacteraceae bacterium]|nr:hypothetical protein [Solirubrobacteraceae bacterium]